MRNKFGRDHLEHVVPAGQGERHPAEHEVNVRKVVKLPAVHEVLAGAGDLGTTQSRTNQCTRAQ